MYFLRRRRICQQTRRDLEASIRQNRRIVLVYHPGQMGSSSLVRTLRTQSELAVWRISSLNPDEIGRQIQQQVQRGQKVSTSLHQAEVLHDALLQEERSPFDVISFVRHPMQRNIDAFLSQQSLAHEEHRGPSTDELLTGFAERFPHHAVTGWFDDDFYPAMQLDLYTQPFHVENGYGVYEHPRAGQVLLMRAEMSWARRISAASLFLRLEQTPAFVPYKPPQRWLPENVERDLRSKLGLDEHVLRELVGSRYCRQFLTAQERDDMLVRWCRRPQPALRIAA